MSNAVEKLTEFVANQPPSSGPRLSHTEKCAAFACLKMGVKQKTVAKAFGLSSAAVAYLAAADRPARAGLPVRYREVVSEFNRMGDHAFLEHYVTDEISARVARLKAELEQAGDDRRLKGPNPKADTYCFDQFGVIETRQGELFRIDWIGGGWLFVDVPDHAGTWTPPSKGGASRYKGMEYADPFDAENPYPERKPFPTSSAAYQGIMLYVGDRKPK